MTCIVRPSEFSSRSLAWELIDCISCDVCRAVYLVSETLYLWALFLEFRQRHDNVHIGHIDQCPTVKSGLYSGAAFLALDATLFFLISLMLTANARSDLLDRDEVDDRGFYGEVTTYPPPGLHAPE